ncbi:autotransporter outer membrane beta-barrel domain-containing protein, partial [Ruegeria sp. WL0004]
ATYTVEVTDSNGAKAQATISIEVLDDASRISSAFTEQIGEFISRRMERILRSEPRRYHLGLRKDKDASGYLNAYANRSLLGTQGGLNFSVNSVSDNGAFFWAEGYYSIYQENRAAGQIDGQFGILHLGGDFSINKDLIVGAMVSFDHSDEEIDGHSNISGNGWMFGPYFSTRLFDDLYLSGRAAWGHSENDASIDVYGTGSSWSGDFSTERFFSYVSLSGQIEQGIFTFIPEASMGYIRDRQNHYLVSDGSRNVGVHRQVLELGIAELSAEMQFHFGAAGNSGTLFVRPSISGEFRKSDYHGRTSLLTGSLDLGFDSTPSENLNYGFAIGYDGFGNRDFDGFSLRTYFDFRF